MSHAPDLEIVSFSVEPQAVKPGQEFTFTATVRNSGTEAISAASWRDGLYEYNDTGYSSLFTIEGTRIEEFGVSMENMR